MRPRGLFDGPFRAGPAQARPARAGRVGGTTGRDSRHGPALSSGRASPALMISCWAVFWAPVFGPCSGWPSWARPIFPALPPPVRPSSTPWRAGGTAARRRPAPCPGPWVMRGGAVVSSLPCVTAYDLLCVRHAAPAPAPICVYSLGPKLPAACSFFFKLTREVNLEVYQNWVIPHISIPIYKNKVGHPSPSAVNLEVSDIRH